MAELKAQGMDFDERIAELEKLEYPKPNRDLIYHTFNEFAAKHPWIGQENIRPKSVAREMYETFQSFAEYIKEYDLQRAEGILLRYLTEVYKALAQNVPDSAKNDEIFAMEVYFGTMVRSVDSSLLEEWQKLRDPSWVAPDTQALQAAAHLKGDARRAEREFTIAIRNEIFRFLRELASRDYEGALALIEPDAQWSASKLETLLEPFYAERSRLLTDTRARVLANTRIERLADRWNVEQIICDLENHNDWSAGFEILLESSRQAGKPCLKLLRIGALT